MRSPIAGAAVWTPADWSSVEAVLFDLDGVLTPTATIHERAWKETFDGFLRRRADAAAAAGAAEPFVEFSEADYLLTVDGKPRFDGVRGFLASRHIELPEGNPQDAPGDVTVCAVGNTKNETFRAVLRRDGIVAYLGSVRLLDWLDARGCAVAVVSSSRNAPEVLAAAGLAARFPVVVDGNVTAALGLPGKPAPEMFLEGARRLAVAPERAMVVEDALVGVAAGRAGAFGVIVGVDRGAGPAALVASGADVVVDDLAELIPGAEAIPAGQSRPSEAPRSRDARDLGATDPVPAGAAGDTPPDPERSTR